MHLSFPPCDLEAIRSLRYGENPPQHGSIVPVVTDDPLALPRFDRVHGPALSYTNWLDADAALYALCHIGEVDAACALVRHAIPCGAAVAGDLVAAFRLAWATDPVAAFGSFVAVNRPADEAFAEAPLAKRRIVRGLLAPEVSPGALRRFERRADFRVLANPPLARPVRPTGVECRSVRGAVLVQEVYDGGLGPDEVEVVSRRGPSGDEWRDLRFARGLVVATRSNAVTLVRDRVLVGVSAGQQDRLRPVQIALTKAGERARGAVSASDAFFPFAFGDAPELLLERILREHEANVQRDLAEVVADAKYGTTANYAFLEQAGIAASISPHATKATYRTVANDAFTYCYCRSRLQ